MEKIFTQLKSVSERYSVKNAFLLILSSFIFLVSSQSFAQTTSWKGTLSTNYFEAANWTAGIPTASSDVIIGDANFTGTHSPAFGSNKTMKSLTIGGGTKAASFWLTDYKAIINVTGNITILTNGTLRNTAGKIYLGGNWNNSGTYQPESGKAGGRTAYGEVILNGSAQTISNATSTTFMNLTINQGVTASLNNPITISHALSVSGILDPGLHLVTVTAASTFTLGTSGILKVKGDNFASNYSAGPTTINAGGVVDFAATDRPQTIAPISKPYSTLIISGGTNKTLTNNIGFAAATTTEGKLLVNSGTLDLAGFTANRATTTAGGTITIANATTLKIGGTSTFPANFTTRDFGSTSTVEYYGTTQNVAGGNYQNLTFSTSGGTYTAASGITVGGNFLISAGATFKGGSFTHAFDGNWTNNGTFTAETSTVNLRGAGKIISGSAHTVFNNLILTNNIVGKATNITVAGNLETSGAGSFNHSAELNGAAAEGTFTMSGATKTILGSEITFDNLTISGTVSSASNLTIKGNLNVSNTSANAFNLTGGTIVLSGTSKTLAAPAGTTTSINFNALRVAGTISTNSSFSIKSDFSGTGVFTASGGTVTFTGTSTYAGLHKFFNVTLNSTITGGKLQLAASSNLGVAGTLTITAGLLDVSTSIPNTVEYNGAAQNITGTNYHNLLLSSTAANTKTAANAITVNGNLQINSSITFSPGIYTHTIRGNWINNGTFTAGTSTIQLTGSEDAQITGATTFATLTINKTAATNTVSLNNNVTAATVNMTSGEIRTGSNTLTITNTRNGAGIILGTITRTHSFAAGTDYAFEGLNNLIKFGTTSGITSVTVNVSLGSVSGFPFGGSINRQYTVTVTGGSYSNATLRLHYKDDELNGNDESLMNLWHNGSPWVKIGNSGINPTENWVEKSALPSINGQYTLSTDDIVMQWTGATNGDWNNAANWSALQGTATSRVPLNTDIAIIGDINFLNQPTVSANTSVSGIQFGNTKSVNLNLSGGNLTLTGNLNGAPGSATHTINVGSQTLSVGGDLSLYNGTAGHAINLSVSSGSVSVSQSIIQAGNAAITFSGAGNLSIGRDYNYTSGNFNAGTGTVTYNGNINQIVAGNISYHSLSINKSAGTATLNAPASILSNLTLSTGGTLQLNNPITVSGNVAIGTGTTLNAGGNVHTVNGNWTNSGTFVPSTGTIKFSGSNNQLISASTFNHLTINKTAGTTTLTGNLTLNANLAVEAGSLNLDVYKITRSAVGGSFTLGANSTLLVGDGNNYPANFNTNTIDVTSTVNYNGTVIQNIAQLPYGNLTLQNGSSNPKNLVGATTVNGNLTIASGATLQTGAYTLTANGNATNEGSFNTGTGTVILAGAANPDGSAKVTHGDFVFNNLTVSGKYELKSGSFTVKNTFVNLSTGNISATTFPAIFSGNFKNEGTMSTSGSVTFSGNQAQTIQLIGDLNATGTAVFNFNGSVAPVLNSTNAPRFTTVNIRNTAGITASANWTAFVMFKVFSGATFNGGNLTHTFHGGFVNEGTVTSEGIMEFNTTGSQNLALGTNFNCSGIVRFGGAGLPTITTSPASFNTIEVTNTNAQGVTPAVNWTVSKSLTIKANGILNGGAGVNHIINGDLVNDGTLIGNSSTFTFNGSYGSGHIQGSGITNFNNLVISDTTIVSSPINLKGNFTNNSLSTLNNIAITFNGAAAQDIAGTSETSFYDLIIANTNSPVTASKNIGVAHNLTVQTGASIKPGADIIINNTGAVGTLGGTGTIEVTRTTAPADYTDQYKFVTYNLNNLTVKFSGNSAQSSNLTSFFNLTINNPAGFTLSGATTVAGTLRLENGNINSNGHILTVGSSVAAPGTVEVAGTGMVIGKLKRWIGNTAGTAIQFPVGKGTIRRMATIHYTAAPSGGTLTAEFVEALPGIAGLPLTEPNGDQPNIPVENTGTSGYWTISAGTSGSESLTGGVYNATLEATSFAGIAKFQAFVLLKRHDGTQPWGLPGTHVPSTGTATSPVISRQGLSGFSDFTIGGNDMTPLPVTLIAFKAVSQGSNALITWKTAQEINNRGYYVEVSTNGKEYRSLGFVESKYGNSQTEQNYLYTDTENGKQGVRYYRLKQVDFDGKATYYGPKAITFKDESNWLLAYPNPFSQSFEVMIEANLNEKTSLTLTNSTGKEIWKTEKQVLAGKNKLPVNMPGNLPAGIYFLKVNLSQTRKVIKLVKE